MTAYRSHRQIIVAAAAKHGTEVALAAALQGGVKPYNVGDWRRRDLIPAERWTRFVDLGLTTLDELAAHVAAPSERAA